MSFDYASMMLSADELIAEFGSSASISRTTAGGYNPETGTSSPESTVTQNVKAVVIDYENSFVDGSLILRGDKQVFISANGVTQPAAGDKFMWQTKEYSVIAVTPLAPAGVNVLFEVQCRGA